MLRIIFSSWIWTPTSLRLWKTSTSMFTTLLFAPTLHTYFGWFLCTFFWCRLCSWLIGSLLCFWCWIFQIFKNLNIFSERTSTIPLHLSDANRHFVDLPHINGPGRLGLGMLRGCYGLLTWFGLMVWKTKFKASKKVWKMGNAEKKIRGRSRRWSND